MGDKSPRSTQKQAGAKTGMFRFGQEFGRRSCILEVSGELRTLNIKTAPLDHQLKLIPLVAPPPPFDPLAEPKRTGSSFFFASSALHVASINDATRAKTTEEQAVRVIENFPILNG
jgi:hypothetical protein